MPISRPRCGTCLMGIDGEAAPALLADPFGVAASWADDRRDPGRARTTRWPGVGRPPGPHGRWMTSVEQGSWDTQAARALRACERGLPTACQAPLTDGWGRGL